MTCSAARNGASSRTYITASAKNDATSDSAPTTGLRCSTTTSAKITATAAKKKKIANSIALKSRKQKAESRNSAGFDFCFLLFAFCFHHNHPAAMNAATITMLRIARGKNTFQPIFISRSYFSRGIVQRTQTKTNSSTETLTRKNSAESTKPCHVGGSLYQGMSQPPRNSVTTSADIVPMAMYSAMKKSANFIDEYSV